MASSAIDMNDTPPRHNTSSRQPDMAHTAFKSAVAHFRDSYPEDTFAGASGVLFEQAMAQTRMAVSLCDPHQPDVPIVFANRAFRNMTGYNEDEIIGRNCRFLQGPDTDRASLDRVRDAIANEDVIVVELLNYRKDGTAFWNALHLGPIYDASGKLVYFFGSQWDVSDVRSARADETHARDLARELSHRMKNMFAVIGGIVNFTGRVHGISNEAREINERIQALGRAYETTLDDSRRGTVEVGQAIRAVLAPYNPDGTRIVFEGNGVRSDFASVSVLGLSLHELAVEAIRHGALGIDGGKVTVGWRRSDNPDSPAIRIDWVEHGAAPRESSPVTGDGIVERMLDMARGGIVREWHPGGLMARLTIPLRDFAE